MRIQRGVDRCPFPACVLLPEHDGDHSFDRPAKPSSELTLVQVFDGRYQRIPCDLAHYRAIALYKDQDGFGWSLCAECVSRFVPFTEGAA
jgi:hypothetical protein